MRSLKIIGPGLLLCSMILVFASNRSEEEMPQLGANQFMVITVQGTIVFQSTGEEMKRGDLYLRDTPLNFITKRSRAAIANKKDGRFVLTGNKRGKISILPAANPISSRAGGILNIVDLKNHFAGDLMILDSVGYKIGKDAFPQSKDTYFYVKYEYNGEVIPKKLSHDGDVLIIDKNELYKVDGKSIPVENREMTLYYKGEDKTYKISSFTPVFPDKEVFKKEVEMLFDVCDCDSDEDKYGTAASHAIDFYGKPDHKNLQDWINKEFK